MARKILLADDSVTAQNMGRKILADAGYEVITVNNGSAALKKIAEAKPDIIVLDVYMPGYSGLEVCQRLKEAQETSRIPVLLTVGKLEPFKPEEAKRVRAEGFIVKPFEASELLAALTKLEDKVVPRPEPSKPGRFARANAALDEGRYDRTVAIDEDSGWKDRIGFPKKKKAQEEDATEEAATYNPVNKDLRTVVERKPAYIAQDPPQHDPSQEESRVDLGALVPEGLPNNVTPEEIAALAAAAAQVKARFDAGVTESASAVAAFAEVKAQAKPAEEKTETKPEATSQEVMSDAPVELPKEPVAEPVATFAAQKTEEPAPHERAKEIADKPEAARSAESIPASNPADLMAALAALGPQAGKSTDVGSGNGFGSHSVSEPAAGHSVSAQNVSAQNVSANDISAPNFSLSTVPGRSHFEQPADEPVTMAVAAGAEHLATASRWSAFAVAVAPEEASSSLEHEMQKAHAAFAAAEMAHAAPVATISEIAPKTPEPAPTVGTLSTTEAAAPEVVPKPVTPEPEMVQAEVRSEPVADAKIAADLPSSTASTSGSSTTGTNASMGATAATEWISTAVKQFEKVVASHAEAKPPVVAEPEPAPVQAAEPAAAAVPESSPAIEARAEAPAIAEEKAPELEPAKPASVEELKAALQEASKIETPEPSREPQIERIEAKTEAQTEENVEAQVEAKTEERIEVRSQDLKKEEPKIEEPKTEAPAVASTTAAVQEISAASAAQSEPDVAAFVRQVFAEHAFPEQPVAEQVSASPVSFEHVSTEQVSTEQGSTRQVSFDTTSPTTKVEPAEGGIRDMAKKESEIAETTAAAWASWRRIRETGDPKASPSSKPKQEDEDDDDEEPPAPAPQDKAAMAVAAGAEKAPEEVPAAADDSGDIASIVDSVLADMRPKIVAEISKKLGKKK